MALDHSMSGQLVDMFLRDISVPVEWFFSWNNSLWQLFHLLLFGCLVLLPLFDLRVWLLGVIQSIGLNLLFVFLF